MTGTLTEATQETAVLELHKKFLEDAGPAHPALAPLRESAIRRFELLKFPHKKHEMYSFVNTQELAGTAFKLAKPSPIDTDFIQSRIYPQSKNSVLVFVDGFYQESLSDLSGLGSSLTIKPLSAAMADSKIKQYLLDTLEEENDVFAALNSAFLSDGIVLDVAAKSQLEMPLQIIYMSNGATSGPVTSYPRLLVQLGTLAELKVIVNYIGAGDDYFINGVQDFLVGEGAGVTFSQFQCDTPHSWHFSKTRVQLQRDSRFISTNACSGSRLARLHYEMHLKEEGAELELNSASVLVDDDQAHNFVRIHHEAPHCTSRQRFKNVINDRGRSSVDGTVIVNRGAQLTNADQLLNNLMLSDDGRADNKPNLMIFADDVKCTHGVTVGQINEDQMFYLNTRGLSAESARTLLTTSFVESVLQSIPFPDLLEDVNRVLLKKLEADRA